MVETVAGLVVLSVKISWSPLGFDGETDEGLLTATRLYLSGTPHISVPSTMVRCSLSSRITVTGKVVAID